LSIDTEGDASTVLSDKVEEPKTFRTNLANETIPESPQLKSNGFTSNKGSELSHQSSKAADKLPEIDKPRLGKVDAGGMKEKPASDNNRATGKLNGTTMLKDKESTAREAGKRVPEKQAVKPSTISTKSTTKLAAKSPTVAKTPTSPVASGSKLQSKTPEVKSKSTPQASAKSAISSTPKRPNPIQISPASGTGFVKPKPKSPTRPVRLPASLTAQTASSVSKVSGSRQTLSRASGNIQSLQLPERSHSRASVSTTATSATGNKGLKRQSSVINRPRPSFGPPPKKVAEDHPIVKTDREVDDSFLARMMRPTQSSSSKTNEKTPVTPPRKTAIKKPAGKDGPGSVKREGSAKKPESTKGVANATVPSTQSAATKSISKSSTSTPPKVERTEAVPTKASDSMVVEDEPQLESSEEKTLASTPSIVTLEEQLSAPVEQLSTDFGKVSLSNEQSDVPDGKEPSEEPAETSSAAKQDNLVSEESITSEIVDASIKDARPDASDLTQIPVDDSGSQVIEAPRNGETTQVGTQEELKTANDAELKITEDGQTS
jgi:hypothetical protein